MNSSDVAPSEAAEAVLRERERQREEEKRKSQRESEKKQTSADEPELELVSVPKWDGAEDGDVVDESELDRRQRALSERLERRQREMLEQSKRLAKVRDELKALEQPIKAEIMQLRERLEESNRSEILLVAAVNALRKDLSGKEKALKKVRTDKQDHVDKLVRVMADYERRKTERLNEIAELVGDDDPSVHGTSQPSKSSFSGF